MSFIISFTYRQIRKLIFHFFDFVITILPVESVEQFVIYILI